MKELNTKCNTLTITADAEFKYKARVRAAVLNLSMSDYIKELVEKDIEAANQAEKKSDNA